MKRSGGRSALNRVGGFLTWLFFTAFVFGCGEDELAKRPESWKLSTAEATVDGTPPKMENPEWPDKEERFVDNSALQRDVFEQNAVAAVDILWIVDNSPSMIEEQDKLADNFNRFIEYLLETNVKYHIGVTSTDTSTSSHSGKLQPPSSDPSIRFLSDELCKTMDCAKMFAEMVHMGTQGSPVEKGLQAAMMALIPPNVAENYSQCGSAPNGCFYRPEANLAIIVVSDEEDSSVSDPNYYKRFFLGLKGFGNDDMITVSAIAGATPNGCFTPYTGSNGVIGSICNPYAGCAGGVCIPYSETQGFCTINCSSDGECGNYKCKSGLDYSNPSRKLCAPDAVAMAGQRYSTVASETGGVFESICEPDFNVALNKLGFTVSGLKREFGLSRLPEIASISVTITPQGGTEQTIKPNDPVDGWTYNATNNSIVFGENILPPQFSTITAIYRIRSK
ncbi:MAG: hypothetical protein Kow0090_09650 [Myxococcota bacterium]